MYFIALFVLTMKRQIKWPYPYNPRPQPETYPEPYHEPHPDPYPKP